MTIPFFTILIIGVAAAVLVMASKKDSPKQLNEQVAVIYGFWLMHRRIEQAERAIRWQENLVDAHISMFVEGLRRQLTPKGELITSADVMKYADDWEKSLRRKSPATQSQEEDREVQNG